MSRRPLRPRWLAALAALSLVAGAGAAVAQAAGGEPAKRRAASVPVRPAPVAPAAVPPRGGPAFAQGAPYGPPLYLTEPLRAAGRRAAIAGVRVHAARCRPRKPGSAEPAPPSAALKGAFGILRRERRDVDALPGEVLDALRARGLGPVDPRSARLLRADADARAWVVPVPDIGVADTLRCIRGEAAAGEGLVVASVGGAAAGGGGALLELRRGTAPATVDRCAGSSRGDMISVSGIVPDGVSAVFVTAPDGSSTRADVRDNGYEFVLRSPRRPQQRFLVWTGSDGRPHVQPLPVVFGAGRPVGCPPLGPAPRVTPDPFDSACTTVDFAPALPAPAPRLATPGRPSGGPRRDRPPLRLAPVMPNGICGPLLPPPVLAQPAPRLLPLPPAAPQPRPGARPRRGP